MELELSTSPRMTWVWASDDVEAEHVRDVLAAKGQVSPPVGQSAQRRITDVGIGAEAFDALESLVAAGYTFRWHPDQHPLNREVVLFGIPVEGPHGS